VRSLRDCRATKREACRSDCDEDRFHFHHGIEPGISPNASFNARCSLGLFRSSLRNPP
jgi:hypothetical protein